MPFFQKKPVVIEAVQLPINDAGVRDFVEWAEFKGLEFLSDRDGGIIIPTLEGDMRAEPGDWIIKGVKGEFYPCKPDIFEMTYEPLVKK